MRNAWLGAAILSIFAVFGGTGQTAWGDQPTPSDPVAIGRQVLAAPLVPWGAPRTEEATPLIQAISAYRESNNPLKTAPLEHFLAEHPGSAWAVSLWLDIGLAHEGAGDYQAAIAALDKSLEAAGPATRLGYSPKEAVVDQTLAELLKLETGFGRASRVAQLLADPRSTADGGVLSSEAVTARQALWSMRNKPDEAFRCGVVALERLLAAENPRAAGLKILEAVKSAPHGLSLSDLVKAAARAGMAMQAVKVAGGAAIPVPSVMHWRMDHYVAILGVEDGRYRVADPAFNSETWISRAVLEKNGSGFFLVPASSAHDAGWRLASAREDNTIRGGGIPSGPNNPQETGGDSTQGGGGCGGGSSASPVGCPHYTVSLMLTSLMISDAPVGYHPPIGPDAEFHLTYNQQDASLPATPNFGWLGPQWSDNWLSYVVDNPTSPGSSVTLTKAGGGYATYSGYNSSTGAFTPEERTGAILTRVSSTEYTRVLPDGSEAIYAAPDGSTVFPRHIFLTQIVNSTGQAQVLAYDSQNRLTTVTDAIGQKTTFQYANPSFPDLLTGVTDPFGRTASIGYDSSGRLNSLTDAIGMHSTFTYNTSSTLPSTFITAMTTPYGTTTFAASLGTTAHPWPYWLTATDPLGGTERFEYNQQLAYPGYSENDVPAGLANPFNEYLWGRDTYYWDKAVYATIPDKSTLATPSYNVADYEKALVYHWQHYSPNTNQAAGVVESMLYPLERNLSNVAITSRIWFTHPGESSGGFTGSLDLPSQIARVLPDGSTQLTNIGYNNRANVTSSIDPAGRETDYSYAANGIDVTKISQKNPGSSGGSDTLAAYTYNAQHEPLTYVAPSGQTTTYTYNAAGQLLTVTDALNETSTYSYDGNGYLKTITDANGKTKASYTYDNVGRIATATDSEGYTLAFTYDNLDRRTKITYPDSTTTTYVYTNLDITSTIDRLGRTTTYQYDADRNLTSTTNPGGRIVTYGYDPDGRLISLKDPANQTTTWTRDIEGRVITKTYADNSAVNYTYDMAGRLATRTDAIGQVTTYGYAKDNRPASLTYANTANPTPNVSYTWDQHYPRMVSMADGTGTTSFAYQAVGQYGALQPFSETDPGGAAGTILYTYDKLSRMNGRFVGGQADTSIAYDALSRVIADSTPLGPIYPGYLGETNQVSGVIATSQNINGAWGQTTYTYYSNNQEDRRLEGFSYNNGSYVGLGLIHWDALGRLTDTYGADWDEWVYDTSDRVTTLGIWTFSPNLGYRYNENAGYNDADFLTTTNFTADIPSTGGMPPPTQAWSATSTGSVNHIATLTPQSGPAQAYTYDANGNVLSDGVRQYKWDAENRLISATGIQSGATSTYTYDGLGRRVAITEASGGGSTTTNYLWCGATLCAAYTGGSLVADYQPWGEVRINGGIATSYYYQQDERGSIRSMTSTTGASLGTMSYSLYGQTLSSSGTAPTFGYAGMFLDQANGLYLTANRAYDPYSARWLSRDPAGEAGGINLYAYVGGDPVNNVDPLGLIARTSIPSPDPGAPNTSNNPNPGSPQCNSNVNGSVGNPIQNVADDGTPGNNQAQNKQFRDAVKALGLNQDQARQLHDEISGQNYGYHEILQIGGEMFGE